MSKINTRETAMFDNRFRHLFYGNLEIGAIVTNKKEYYVTMLGKEFRYLLRDKHKLQGLIEAEYIRMVYEISEQTGISRFNSDGIDLRELKELSEPVGIDLANVKIIRIK